MARILLLICNTVFGILLIGEGQASAKTSASGSEVSASVQTDIHQIARALDKANTRPDSPNAVRNTNAQVEVANWTPKLFCVAAAEAAITAIGVALVALTLRHTKRAADAARDTVDSMEKTAKRQLRAYVIVDSVDRSGRYKWPPEFTLIIRNAGQTPAHRMTVRTGELLSDIEPAPNSISLRENADYEIPLGPNHSSEHQILKEDLEPVTNPLSYEDFFNGKPGILFIDGIIEYYDAFGDKRETRFRFSYGRENALEGGVSFCKQGNSAT